MTGSGWRAPTRAQLLLYLRLLAGLTLLFAAVYGGCNWLTRQRGDTRVLHAQWELAIPFVPALIYVYLSIGLLFWLPLFCLEERRMVAIAKAFAAATLAAGVVFLLLPARLGFERPASVAGYGVLYAALYQLDLAHNLVPSLHIAYSTLIVGVTATAVRGPSRAALLLWLVAIVASVVLVRQHHLLDVAGGLLLGWLALRLYGRLAAAGPPSYQA